MKYIIKIKQYKLKNIIESFIFKKMKIRKTLKGQPNSLFIIN